MNPLALLDTNVILRYVLDDHPEHSPRAATLIHQIATGELTVRLTETVVFETVYVLGARYKVPRTIVRERMLALLGLSGMILPGKGLYPEVFNRWVDEPSLSFADSYHLSLAKSLVLTGIISFDRKIAKDPAVTRIDP